MVSFRISRKLSSHLVRAKLHHTERVVGSFKCNKPQCLVCVNATETNTLISTVTHKTYKINHNFDCDKNCLVYLLMCKHCSIQYVGQTVDNTSVTDGIMIKTTVENTHISQCQIDFLFSVTWEKIQCTLC